MGNDCAEDTGDVTSDEGDLSRLASEPAKAAKKDLNGGIWISEERDSRGYERNNGRKIVEGNNGRNRGGKQ